jgi:transposase InsO family protein
MAHHRQQVLRLAGTLRHKVNEHNGWVPRDFWLEEWEKQAIIGFHLKNPLEGYRRLTFMMLDADIVAVSPSSVWLSAQPSRTPVEVERQTVEEGHRLRAAAGRAPALAHRCSYPNIGGTFYYLCSILDGLSRYIVNWDIRESMTEADVALH